MTPYPVEIAAGDGCVLRGQVWPGESDWMVLLHDVRPDEDLDRWRPLVSSLLAERLTVLAVDLRGHGASDGEWQGGVAADDLSAIVRFARTRGAELVVVVAAGVSAVDALWAVGREGVDGVVSLSATAADGAGNGEDAASTKASPLPRAPGISKLFIVGVEDHAARDTTAKLRAASIGWSLVVTFPTQEHGTEFFAGAWASHVREQVLGFTRECRYLAGSGHRLKGAGE